MLGALLLALQTTSFAILISNVAATDSNNYELDHVFDKRQNYTCSTAGLEDVCETNTEDCINAMCASCSGYVYIANCCALSSYTEMMQCILELESNPAELTETVAPTSTTSADTSTITASSNVTGIAACSDWEAMVFGCVDDTPGFTTEVFSQQARCLCYSNGTYRPDLYDGMFSGCLAYLSTADPAGYSSVVTAGSVDSAPCKNLATATPSSSGTHYIGHLTSSTSTAAATSVTPGPTTFTGPTQTPAAESNGSTGLESSRPISLGWFLWLWGTCVVVATLL
ncbi:uncharacterized protein Z520_01650 [Fonsecaea multimorphosa CBS 102226]|uniref:Extracellular membrane protein CFEM domain-containing protein n=1 Tax=Fonsecaea multimorphosa CBS 102226 TaxID=1442371 RepID=A0A0D2KB03_9EURO|nr:uncharacterized protein Z520_01650 [Fonsecaea multimorphosa CBS 102226]KIY03183.1 hypothetical protein Z520_01650 [Fonsecaea multimorphosa CBS 102226]